MPREALADHTLRLVALNENSTSHDRVVMEDLVEPVQQINAVMRPYGVQFELSDDYPQPITRLVDLESGDVIRQIPGEEVLQVASRLEDLRGRLVSQEA